VAVVAARDGVLHQPVGEVVIIGGGAAGGTVKDGSQGAAVVVGIADGVAVLPGLGQQTAVVIVAEADMIAVAVGLLLQVAVGVIGIAVAHQCAAADGDAASQGKIPIAEAVGGAGCLDGRQLIFSRSCLL